MSMEAIVSVTTAEQAAKNAVAAAQVQAKQLLADAEAAGKVALEAARAKADSELELLRRRAGEKSRADTAALTGRLEKDRTELRLRAGARLADAAALIVERIVND
ncbi:MAG: hypothetical protein IK095_08405 [Oscillospiraceae bacterium]|nr:hypothetical protein [Oscillospiraceae bacterium]